jgi:hypothetical protein
MDQLHKDLNQVTKGCFNFETTLRTEKLANDCVGKHLDLSWPAGHPILDPRETYTPKLNPRFKHKEIEQKLTAICPIIPSKLIHSARRLLEAVTRENQKGLSRLTTHETESLSSAEKSVLQQLLDLYEIDCVIVLLNKGKDSTQSSLDLLWKNDNPLLKPTVIAESFVETARAAYFGDLLETGEFSDFTIEVRGKKFPCHRTLLNSSRYFRTLFESHLEEAQREVVKFDACDAKRFSEVLDFIYTGKFPPQENCIEMFKLACFLENKALIKVTKWQIFKYCTIEQILDVAFILMQKPKQDPDLEKLCSWFFHTQVSTLDLSELPSIVLLEYYQLGLKYDCETLKTMASSHFDTTFNPNDELIPICQKIEREKSAPLRDFIKSHFEKTIFYSQLCQEKYAQHRSTYQHLLQQFQI